jgi:hypothetical protein
MSNINVTEYNSEYAYNAALAGADVAIKLTEAANSHTEKDLIEGFAKQLGCTHRTLQASAVRVLLKGLVKWAQDAEIHNNFDARNIVAVNKVLGLAPKINDSPIPFI